MSGNAIKKVSSNAGKVLEQRRKRLGLTQLGIAEMLNVSNATISIAENSTHRTTWGIRCAALYDELERARAIELTLEHPEVMTTPKVRRLAIHQIGDQLADLLDGLDRRSSSLADQGPAVA